MGIFFSAFSLDILTFIPASNGPNGCACTSIRRLPRGSNTPQLSCVTSMMPRQPAEGYLTEMVQYKAQNAGLNVILTEESYTSGTSFLDNEQPVKENYNKSRRKERGLFISNRGIKINADVNGAYQIMKKVFPNVSADGIEGVALHPVRVSVA